MQGQVSSSRAWRTERTQKTLLRRYFRAPRGVEVGVELADLEDEVVWEDHETASRDATLYRAVVAMICQLSVGREDTQYLTKEAARRMAKPTNTDWQLVKRYAKHLLGKARVVHTYTWQQ